MDVVDVDDDGRMQNEDQKKSFKRSRNKSSSRSNSPDGTLHKRKFDKPPAKDKIDKRNVNDVQQPKAKPATQENILWRTGGAYIPPARLRQMQAQITDKSSEAFQRIAWEALKKSIHGFINKVNVSNITLVVRELLSENIVRGRGLFVRSLLTAQNASPTFTHVFAALVAVVNTKFPQVGELLLKRLVNEFRKAFRRNQKDRCLTTSRFLAHLVNQKVAHELIILELLTLLLEQTTDDSVEVAVSVLKECGAFLSRAVPKGVLGIFEHLRRILNEGECDKRVSYMLEVMFQIRRDGWKDHPTVLPELDLIEEDDQITHTLSLLDPVDSEDGLNVFRFDGDYEANEEKYAAIRSAFLDSDSSDSGSEGDSEDGSDSDAEEERAPGAAMGADQSQQTIIDQTETNLVHLRRTIYLTLQSCLSAEEAGHRLLQLKIKPGEEYEVASMVLDCCAQTRSYESRYGRLAQRLCHVVLYLNQTKPTDDKKTIDAPRPTPGGGGGYSRTKAAADSKSEESGIPVSFVVQFERIFGEQYSAVHRLETAKLRNVALFFSHLLYTDSISWGVLECIKLNERDTTSSGRIFLKHLFLELCSFMGLANLQTRLRDETLQQFFIGLLPRDNPKDTRFAINFLTTIGLGGLTLDLREFLQASREAALAKKQAALEADSSGSSVSSRSSTDSDGSSSSSSTTSSSSSSSGSSTKKKRSRRRVSHKRKQSEPDRESQTLPPRQDTPSKDESEERTQLSSVVVAPARTPSPSSPRRYNAEGSLFAKQKYNQHDVQDDHRNREPHDHNSNRQSQHRSSPDLSNLSPTHRQSRSKIYEGNQWPKEQDTRKSGEPYGIESNRHSRRSERDNWTSSQRSPPYSQAMSPVGRYGQCRVRDDKQRPEKQNERHSKGRHSHESSRQDRYLEQHSHGSRRWSPHESRNTPPDHHRNRYNPREPKRQKAQVDHCNREPYCDESNQQDLVTERDRRMSGKRSPEHQSISPSRHKSHHKTRKGSQRPDKSRSRRSPRSSPRDNFDLPNRPQRSSYAQSITSS